MQSFLVMPGDRVRARNYKLKVGMVESRMENVSKYVLRSTRWTALRHNRDYVAYWGVHAGGPAPREPAPFAVRRQTRADLEAARWGLLAWENPAVGMAASPFWIDANMPRGRFDETDDRDSIPILALLEESVATLTGLRLLDGALVLRIARGSQAGQARLADADTGDAARCGLSLMIALDQEFPENLDQTTAVCLVAWPLRRSSSAGRQRARP